MTDMPRIALLATGDEIVHGDILNTNSTEIAAQLFTEGMPIGIHMAVRDNKTEIEHAIQFLLSTHAALIITGGLGPTSDDVTRFALASALKRELVFDQATWHSIVQRLQHLGYATPPENNRQQALFPEGAAIIPNPHGTASGCSIALGKQMIFMLPGPPAECLPMLTSHVLPLLQKTALPQPFYFRKWLLFGVSEGKIAEELDAITKNYQCTTGYRITYPYVEFKLYATHADDFFAALPHIEKAIAPYLIGDGEVIASKQLQTRLTTLPLTLTILDNATGGALQAGIHTPANDHQLKFNNTDLTSPHVTITGLTEFWQQKPDCAQTSLSLEFHHQHIAYQINATIPYRGSRVKAYAVEWIAMHLNEFIQKIT